MKLLSDIESFQISGGGTLRMGGVAAYVDTTGIPSHCASQIEGMMNAVFAQAEKDSTASGLMNVMGPHMDRLMNSGCDSYMDLYGSRLNSAILI